MNAAQMSRAAQAALSRFLYLNPEARNLPPHIDRVAGQVERYHEVDTRLEVSREDLEAIREEIENSQDRAERRAAEHALAEYIMKIAHHVDDYDLHGSLQEVSRKLSNCRMTGTVGAIDGRIVTAWDQKCGLVRLCPDESREETERLTDFYLPAMLDFKKASPLHRVFYSVLTIPNHAPGELAQGKQAIFDKFRELTKSDYYQDKVQGAFVIEEDPFSARGDWNIHLNVFFLVKTDFSYKRLRELWGCDLHIDEIKGDAQDMRNALLEAVKYSAQIVPDKSQHHSDTGQSKAPAMTEWPSAIWLEWWEAQQGFRRTRAYGCLYALHGKKWDKLDVKARIPLLEIAEAPLNLCHSTWKEIGQDLPKKDRERLKNRLRKAMQHGQRIDLSRVEWVGAVEFTSGGFYSVSLILGDNFFQSSKKRDNWYCDQAEFWETGPPG